MGKTRPYLNGLILPILALGISLGGCNRKGCTDIAADNFDPDAKTEDGTCQYSTGKFQLGVDFVFDGMPLGFQQTVTDPLGTQFSGIEWKIFLSGITLLNDRGEEAILSEVSLISLEDTVSQMVSGNFPAQHITGIRFGIGLDSALNHSDPVSYPSDHPMSSSTGMFWNLSTQYIFAKVDAVASTDGIHLPSANHPISYHIGRDTVYQERTITGWDIDIIPGMTATGTLTVDLKQLLFGPSDTIRYWDPNERTTHMLSPDQVDLGIIIADHYATAIH